MFGPLELHHTSYIVAVCIVVPADMQMSCYGFTDERCSMYVYAHIIHANKRIAMIVL